MKSILSTMTPVPWTVLSHELRATAPDIRQKLPTHVIRRVEVERVMQEIRDRVSGVETERQDKLPRPGFQVKSVVVYVWAKGCEYRFDSVSKACDQGFNINSKVLAKLREGGHHQSKKGAVFWCLNAPDFVQDWRDTGVMKLPKLPRKGLMAGRKPVPCFSYVRNGEIEYHDMMNKALIRATGKTHGNIKSTISKGVGHFHFRNGSWVWRATVPTPPEVIMLLANRTLG